MSLFPTRLLPSLITVGRCKVQPHFWARRKSQTHPQQVGDSAVRRFPMRKQEGCALTRRRAGELKAAGSTCWLCFLVHLPSLSMKMSWHATSFSNKALPKWKSAKGSCYNSSASFHNFSSLVCQRTCTLCNMLICIILLPVVRYFASKASFSVFIVFIFFSYQRKRWNKLLL